MIRSFEIRGYRCFSRAYAENLSRINIIVGQSGTGKTALLEALFICGGGNPQHYFHILNWRGVVGQKIEVQTETYDLFFREMFHRFDSTGGISIRIEDTDRGQWSLEIGTSIDSQKQLVSPGDPAVYTPITFKSKSGSGKTHRETIRVEEGLNFTQAPEPYQIHFLNNVTLAQPVAPASRFSQIVQEAREEAVIQALNEIYKNIVDVRLVTYAGGNVLLASVDGLGRIPISSVSGGINKYLNVLLTLGHKQRNVVLIDEMENGFYYSNLTQAWEGILAACRATDSQVFLTTHSRECLIALLPVMKKKVDDFALIRTEKLNGEIVLVPFSGKEMHDSLKQHFEIR